METILLSTAGAVIGICLVILGYFLKIIHNDVRKNTLEVGKLKSRHELLRQESTSKVDQLKVTTEIHIGQLTTNVSELTKSITNMNQNMSERDREFTDIWKKLVDVLDKKKDATV